MATVEHVLSAEQFPRERIDEICDRAELFAAGAENELGGSLLTDMYRGYACVTVFGEASTRTRISSEAAAGKILGMHVSSLTTETASTVKGETPGRTALTLGALGANLIVMRLPEEGAVAKAARESFVPVVNGGDGANEHPTQMLLDIATARRRLGDLTNSRWVVFGDIGHSRTLNSLIFGLGQYDARLTLVASEGLGPSDRTMDFLRRSGISYDMADDLRDAVSGAHVLYGIRTQAERHKDGVVQSSVVLNQGVLNELDQDTIILHPGPHGPEIADEVYGHPNAVFPVEQVRTGTYVRAALFDSLLDSRAYQALISGEVDRAPLLSVASV